MLWQCDAQILNDFLQQYLLKKEYFSNEFGGILVYINDGDVFTSELLETGLMHDIAIETYSALATADLRYFRSNLPTG